MVMFKDILQTAFEGYGRYQQTFGLIYLTYL